MDSQKNMISVIVPIFNSAKSLPKCLDSILSQTYQDFEIILVNDGSTDSSEDICMEYVQFYSEKIHYFGKTNSGVSSARNMGLEMANGEYVCFVDSDDYVDATYLEVLVNAVVEHNADFSMCDICRNTNVTNEDSILLNNKDNIIYAIMSSQYGAQNRGPCCKIFLKKVLQDGPRFAEDIYLGEDTLFCIEYAKKCNRGVYVRQGLYHYDTPTSSIAYRTDAKMLTKYLTYIDSRKEMLKDTTMLSRESYSLIINSLYTSILESYFIARNAKNLETQSFLCRMMKEMQRQYPISAKNQDMPATWWIMAHVTPKSFDAWMFVYGKWHGLLKRIGLS